MEIVHIICVFSVIALSSAFKLTSTDSCPNSDGIFGICVFDPSRNCVGQDQCPSGYKCCPYGCGSQCLAVTVKFQHLGTCPSDSTGSSVGKACGHDQACKTNEKCCSGHCVAAFKLTSTDSCPNSDGIFGICVFDPSRNCVGQDQCPSGYKCCPYGCGSQCLAVTVKFQHLGTCPSDSTGSSVGKACGHDQACKTNEKCCSGHCVAVRKFSVNVLNPIQIQK